MRRSQATNDHPTIIERYPSCEGANILTGIGFKHIMYLGEEAILEHCRAHQLGPQLLYEAYGLALEIVSAEARLLASVHLDDLVRVEVRDVMESEESALCHDVRIFVQRNSKVRKALASRWKLIFRREHASEANVPVTLARYVIGEIHRSSTAQAANPTLREGNEVLLGEDPFGYMRARHPGAFVCVRLIPYFYCHYSKRLQYSGYLRLVEEAVALFLADRGISIRTMFEQRQWVPVVTDFRVEVLREALMEEYVYTVFRVEGIYKKLTFAGLVDFYLVRGAELIHVATGKITHAYLQISGRDRWAVVPLDGPTIAALTGTARV